MHNVHERTIAAPAAELGAMLDRLGGPEDPLWPSPAWTPMVLDRPLQVGAKGGHGPIRYRVTAHEPGRRVAFTFHPATGLLGTHTFTLTPLGADRCRLRHEITGTTRGAMRLLFPVAVEALHDALLEDLLDNAERAATGHVRRPAHWSPWIRVLHRLIMSDRPREVPLPVAARLARAALPRTDLTDAWQVELRPGHPTDPGAWADAVFRDPPAWVGALLGLRNVLAPLIGVERADRHAFDTLDRAGRELLLGADAGHLDFRCSVLVAEDTVTLGTAARCKSPAGRLYLAVVRVVHPVVVRAMLARASRQLGLRATKTSVTKGRSHRAPISPNLTA